MLINTALQVKQSWLHLIFYIWMEKKTPKKWHILHFIMKSLWMRIFINEIRKKSFSAVDMIKGGGGYYWGSPVTQVWCYSEFPLTAWEWKWALAGLPGSRHAPRGRSRALQSTATHQDRGALRLAMSVTAALRSMRLPQRALPHGSGRPQMQWAFLPGVQRQSVGDHHRPNLRCGEST